MAQKNTLIVAGVSIKIMNLYAINHREKSPVLGEVIAGNNQIKKGQIGLFHHNNYYPPSPFYLYDDLFSVPFNKTVFGIVHQDGAVKPLCGNILCDRVEKEYSIYIPPEQREKYIDRVIVTNPGDTPYKAGQLLFTRPHAYYEIVYNVNGIEHRIHKVHAEMVVGMDE